MGRQARHGTDNAFGVDQAPNVATASGHGGGTQLFADLCALCGVDQSKLVAGLVQSFAGAFNLPLVLIDPDNCASRAGFESSVDPDHIPTAGFAILTEERYPGGR